MRSVSKIAVAALVLAIGSTTFAQEILLNQPANDGGLVFADANCDFCGGPQTLAVFMFLAADSTATRTKIRGAYDDNVPVPDSFTISVRDDAAGLPITNGGTAIDTLSGSRTMTGMDILGRDQWEISLNHVDFSLLAGQYWVEVFNDTGAGTTDWLWQTGDPDPAAGFLFLAFAFEAPGVNWFGDDTLTMNIQVIEDDPLLVTMESFTGRRSRDGGIKLSWKTTSEVDNAGFRVLRGVETRDKALRLQVLTPQLIPAAGNTLEGAEYSFKDSNPPTGRVFYYLEDVDYNGRANRHGPVIMETRGLQRVRPTRTR